MPTQLIWRAGWPRTHGRLGGLWDGNLGCPGPVLPTSPLLPWLCFLHGGHCASHRSGSPPEGECRLLHRLDGHPTPSGCPKSGTAEPRLGTPLGVPGLMEEPLQYWSASICAQHFPRETPQNRTRRWPRGRGAGEGLALQCVRTALQHASESSLGYRNKQGTSRKDGSRGYRCELKLRSTHREPGTPKDPTAGLLTSWRTGLWREA